MTRIRSILLGVAAASALAFGASGAFAAGLGSNIVVVNNGQNSPGNVQNAAVNGQVLANNVAGGSTISQTAENVQQLSSVGNLTQNVGGGFLPIGTNSVTITTQQLLTSVQPQTVNATQLVQGNTVNGSDISGLAANVGQLQSVGNIGQGLN